MRAVDISNLSKDRSRCASGKANAHDTLFGNVISYKTADAILSVVMPGNEGKDASLSPMTKDAYFALGHFAIAESIRKGMPDEIEGLGERMDAFLNENMSQPGVSFLDEVYNYGIGRYGMDADRWAFELVQGVLDSREVGGRFMDGCVRILRDSVVGMTSRSVRSIASDEIDATIVGLVESGKLQNGDTVALGLSIFDREPFLPMSAEAGVNIEYVDGVVRNRNGKRVITFPGEEIAKMAGGGVRAFIPAGSQAGGYVLEESAVDYLSQLARHSDKQLEIVGCGDAATEIYDELTGPQLVRLTMQAVGNALRRVS